MEIIKNAVSRYEREIDRYMKMATRVAEICRRDIVDENAIRAQVNSRAKTLKSFETKIFRISKYEAFNNVDSVFEKIKDLSGVRITAYQPGDISKIKDSIENRFNAHEIEDKNKDFPNFYISIHCQVSLLEEDLLGTYENLKNSTCEIQICSIMSHVWNEIEHDIGYKPKGVEISLMKKNY